MISTKRLVPITDCDEKGDIIATGSTEDVLTQEILEKVFNIDVVLNRSENWKTFTGNL